MAANYVLLERVELAASAASITLANIPQSGYTDLKLVASLRQDNGIYNYGNGTIAINGGGTAVTSKSIYGEASIPGTGSNTSVYLPVSTSINTANTFSSFDLYFPNYLSSAYKSFSADLVSEGNSTSEATEMHSYLWSNTAAITTITLGPSSGNFVANSTVSLYGLAAVGTTPTIAPKASGGNIYNDGTYWYHAFLSSGTFTPQVGLTCDALVVAGGGGGGGNTGAGGGAGGLLGFTSQALTATNYTVTVGAGGAGAWNNTGDGTRGTNGANSQFGALTAAVGGGGGGSYSGASTNGYGASGGSGGGGGTAEGASYTNAGGSATSGQGYAGGTGFGNTSSQYASGGGGGAGATGGNASSTSGGLGGVGLSTYSSWGLATTTGQNVAGTVYYAGGGGGSNYNTNQKAGGYGGGGAGAYSASPGSGANAIGSAGTANTGGGGGGGQGSLSTYAPSGGSGIVIIRYAI